MTLELLVGIGTLVNLSTGSHRRIQYRTEWIRLAYFRFSFPMSHGIHTTTRARAGDHS